MKRILQFPRVVLILILAGCGGNPKTPVIKIGCAAPLSGDQAQIGLENCRGVELAVAQAEENGFAIPGYRFQVMSQDDQHNPSQAVNVAKKFAADRDVMGVIGHFNSSCTKPASAIYYAAGMVQITPASTNPDISKQGFNTFFRVSATDDIQGPSGARYAASSLGIKTVILIDDKTTYGKGLADEFEKEAKKQGLSVLTHEGITQGDKDFTPLLIKIKPLNPDMIYFGGIYPEGALLIRQARSLQIPSLFMGGDGIASPMFIELASPEIAEGTYATMVGQDMKKVPAAEKFIQNYEAKYGPVGLWSAYGYDAANILMSALTKAGVKDRGKILEALRSTPSFTGITGIIAFDEKGDNKNQVLGIFKVHSGKLDYVEPAQ
ncbi:MAG: branched-chain amino acid ABC transporter substrate-binding protein [Candidatus Omnitrophica bacterium]|nr:branched-chain amino acid ABC transporter substrate-binding protein [Candidatus Omnitrophota bacterium]